MIIAKYIHGSEDSTDIDVHYVFDVMPSFKECKIFCDSDKTENRNIITIDNGIVTNCYKGTVDEINNALLRTYKLHEQSYPLLIEHNVKRDITLKYIRSVRIILSYLSHTIYRRQIKLALKSNKWEDRLNTLSSIDLAEIDFDNLNKHNNKFDICKVFAFQIGQCFGLMNNIELYTKSEITFQYPLLENFLYRKEFSIQGTNLILHMFTHDLDLIDKKQFENYDIINEKRII